MENRQHFISMQYSRNYGKTASIKLEVQRILQEDPNALICLISKDGLQVVTGDNNTNIKELKENDNPNKELSAIAST